MHTTCEKINGSYANGVLKLYMCCLFKLLLLRFRSEDLAFLEPSLAFFYFFMYAPTYFTRNQFQTNNAHLWKHKEPGEWKPEAKTGGDGGTVWQMSL